MLSGSDQRQHPRIPLILQVEHPDREGFLAGATENLSEGGVFVQTERQLAVGDRLPLQLSFPGLVPPLELVGVVAWLRPARDGASAGLGVRIPDDRPGDKERLSQLLRSLGRPEPARPGSFRILLVEDNPHVMELYEYVLKKLSKTDKVDIAVDVARDGHDALKQLGQHTYDLVVTDLYMPVLDGFELIRKLRSQERIRGVPVIAISAGDREAQRQALEAGADVFLRKPVRFIDVLETVKSLLKL